VLLLLAKDGALDERAYRAMRAARAELPARFRGTQAEMRETIRREALLLRSDREAALRGLRTIFASPQDRASAEAALRKAADAVGARIDMTPSGPMAVLLERSSATAPQTAAG
jgi:hypothetical protein